MTHPRAYRAADSEHVAIPSSFEGGAQSGFYTLIPFDPVNIHRNSSISFDYADRWTKA